MNEEAAQSTSNKKKKVATFTVLGVVLLFALLVFLYWVLYARFHVSTKDAYVHGNSVEVYSQIQGSVSADHIEITSFVKEGEVLVELDATDYVIAFEKSKAALANTVRQVVKMFDQVYQLKAQVEQQKSQLLQAEIHFQNREALLPIGAIAKEDFQNAETNLLSAQAALNQALENLKGSEAQIYNTTVESHPKVQEAKDQVRVAWLNLQRTIIKAPVDGYVAKKNTQVGESVSTQGPIASIVPLHGLWANANFKENKLNKIRIGQEVELSSAMYGSQVKYKGTVVGISPGTGSVFSVLPPQNATGNWISIVQRVPVKIVLNERQLKEHPLRLGLSLKAKIDTRNQSGAPLCKMAPSPTLTKTTVFQSQIYGVESIIDQVIQDNINPSCD